MSQAPLKFALGVPKSFTSGLSAVMLARMLPRGGSHILIDSEVRRAEVGYTVCVDVAAREPR